MPTLLRVHHDAHATAFLAYNGARFTISAKGQYLCDNFVDAPLLQERDLDPDTSIVYIRDHALWVQMHLSDRQVVVSTRMMELGDTARHRLLPAALDRITQLHKRYLRDNGVV
jgi:hypothetical protein